MLKSLLIISLLFGFWSPAFSWASLQESRSQLKSIRQRMENVQTEIGEKKQSETAINRELAVLKRTLKKIDLRISDLRKQQQQLTRQVNQQQKEIDAGQYSMHKISRRVEKRLVALYKEGDSGLLKILFSTDSPTELVQQYQYLTRVLEADKELIDEYWQALRQQQAQLFALQQLKEQQQKLLDQEQQERQTAKQGARLQTKILSKVRSDKGRYQRELSSLREKSGRLKQLIEKLEVEAKRTRSAPPAEGSGFGAGKGKLNWPVKGNVLIGFGTQKDAQLGTIYESNGVEIAVADGQPMNAVAAGKVVYADWFKGYGNLIILSHPGGYHTLYAQAARLEREIGDSVKAGDLVAYSGLAGRDSIYFEVRYNGAPVDPLKWLRRR